MELEASAASLPLVQVTVVDVAAVAPHTVINGIVPAEEAIPAALVAGPGASLLNLLMVNQ